MTIINLNSYSYKFMNVKYVRPEIGPALTIEFIPKSCQGNSLYHLWPKKHWDKLRKLVYKRANYSCEICGGGPKIECHEVWHFDIKKRVQKLVMLVCLCHDCHSAKHFGHAYLTGKSKVAVQHICKINGWSMSKTLDYIDGKYERHEKYIDVKFKSKMDLRLLSDFIERNKIKTIKPKKRKKAKKKSYTRRKR